MSWPHSRSGEAAPPAVEAFTVDALDKFDDDALHTFLDPQDGVIDLRVLGAALAGSASRLQSRVRAVLPEDDTQSFDRALRTASVERITLSRRRLLRILFWPLVYWNSPDDYEELVSGEQIHPSVIASLELGGHNVCDIGAGTGRLAVPAARVAQHVTAVDAVPAMLRRLEARAQAEHLENVSVVRAAFSRLPLADGAVHVAVACSSFTNEGSPAAERALAEAERIVEPGGQVAVIWPNEPGWYQARGYTHLSFEGNEFMHFRNVATAQRLCSSYYSSGAAEWVRVHQTADVPFRVLGTSPPNSVCIKRVA